MKTINILVCSMLAVTVSVTSCRKLEEINVNPNSLTSVNPQLILPKVQVTAASQMNSTSPLYAIKMLVQSDGESEEQFYKWDRGSFDAYNNLRDITKMAEEAEKAGMPAYLAVAKFFRAWYFYNMTLHFGDIPYSEALKGESGEAYAPAYDDQKSIFKGILSELEEANDILNVEKTIIAGDLVYRGDVTKWQKLVNSFRLKVLMTLSRKTADTDLTVQASFRDIADNEPLFQGNFDNAQLVWLDQQGNRYPQFNSSGFGSGMYMDSTFIQRLQERKDPRLFIFATQTKSGKESGKLITDFSSYEGGDPAAPYASINVKATQGIISKVNERYYKDPATEPTMLMGYSELQLILAEAAVRGWITGEPANYYNEGVKASFAFYNDYAKGYEQYVDETAANEYLALSINDLEAVNSSEEKIARIILQKYLQSFLQRNWEPYFEALRTSYPSFRRPAGVNLPYRFMYPTSEITTNTTNLEAAISRQFGEGNDNISQMTWWMK